MGVIRGQLSCSDDGNRLGYCRLFHHDGFYVVFGGCRHPTPQNPGVFGAATLGAIHDELSLGQCYSSESTREHPHVSTVVDRKRSQIGVTRAKTFVDQGGDRGERHHILSNPAARITDQGFLQLGQFLLARSRPHDEPFTARAIHGFDHELVESIQNLLERLGLFEPPGVDVWQEWFFRKVIADEVGDIGINELVIGDPVPDSVSYCDVAQPCRQHEARGAEQRINAELKRIKELIIDSSIDDIDSCGSSSRPHPHPTTRTEEVTTLDELHAHQASEKGVFEVGRVIHARGENHDGGVLNSIGCSCTQRLQQLEGVVPDWPHAHAHEQLGKGLRHHTPVGDDIAHTAWNPDVVLQDPPHPSLIAN